MLFTLLNFSLALAPLSTGPLDVDAIDVAPGIVTWIERRLNLVVSGNVTAVIGNESVLIFDSGHHPGVTREIIADLKRRTSKPVSHVVISHWHDDHWVAASVFSEAWPQAQVIAHPFTAAMMVARAPQVAPAACRKELDPVVTAFRERVRTGKRPDGTPFPENVRARNAAFLEGAEEAQLQCDQIRPVTVSRVISDSATITLGGRSVVVRHPGRANTAGDLIAIVPELRTVLTGDLVVSPWPFATGPYMSEWITALKSIEGLRSEILIPGHGPIMRDPAYLRELIDLFESLASQARAAWQPGMSLDSLRAKVDLSSFATRFSRGDPFVRANFDAQMAGAVTRMWQELANAWTPERP